MRRIRTRRGGSGAAASRARRAGSWPEATRVASSASTARKIAADSQIAASAPRLRGSRAGAGRSGAGADRSGVGLGRSVIAGLSRAGCAAGARDDGGSGPGGSFRARDRRCRGSDRSACTRRQDGAAGAACENGCASLRPQCRVGAGRKPRHHQREDHQERGEREHCQWECAEQRMGATRRCGASCGLGALRRTGCRRLRGRSPRRVSHRAHRGDRRLRRHRWSG